ncbi:hypothetical protein FHS23_002090 [Prauserella isguenensis]|uniref:Uncharacterized protein n=1 Tax=Prauserella isguenensis TaxID=1470180 RepID=A0A839S2Y8_9PSEU|nr:hypothetical protein [Prauserella isguenensis]MBB3051067.1 hypothetical protein [Prauserella isguenensis]
MGRHYRADDPAPGQPDPLRKARQAIGGANTGGGTPDDWFRDTTTPPAAYRSTPGYAPAPDDVLSTSPAMHPVAPRRTADESATELTTRLDPVPPAGPTSAHDSAGHDTSPATPDRSTATERPPHPRPRPDGRPRFHGAGHAAGEHPPAAARHDAAPSDRAHDTGTDDHDAHAAQAAASSRDTTPGRTTDTDRDPVTSTGGRRRVTSTGRHSTVSATGGHRAVTSTGRHGTVTSTGSHRAVDKKPKRRVAAWPVACGVLVVLVVAGFFGWNWADGVLSNRAEAQAAACQEGRSTLRVATDPAVAEPVQQAAKAWNDDDTVVHGHCITVKVQPGTSQVVYGDLTGNRTRGTPGAWIMADTKWADRLGSEQPDRIGASPEKIASGPDGTFTYVSLAGDGVDTVQQRAAQSFRSHLTSPQQQKRFEQAGFTG